ncbi:hypothetical protein F5B21DRAFT_491591 [Xylaria acuta]|nr:hypothetical protein F5B21DRAFT_491591 [Xylaria acuta]
MEMEGKRACDTSQATHTQHGDAASVTPPPRVNVHGQVRESAYGEDNETIVKREQEDEYHVAPGGYRYKPPAVSDIAPLTPARMSRPSIYQGVVPSSASGKDNATTMPDSPAALTPGDELRTGQGRSIQRTASRYRLHSQVVPSRSTSNTDLLAGINKLKAAIKEFSLTVDQLPADSATAFLDTAARDTKLDIEYLEDLVREYLRD